MASYNYNFRFENPPTARMLEAAARRIGDAKANVQFVEWFSAEVSATVKMSVFNRMRFAVEFVRSKVVTNISRPVTKTYGRSLIRGQSRSHVVISNRSKRGEYPKADTEKLIKTLFGLVEKTGTDQYNGYVGSPMDYSIYLELSLDRSFLVRTLREEWKTVVKMLAGPTKENQEVVSSSSEMF